MLSVIVPTIAGREESLARAVDAYVTTSPPGTEVIVEAGHATCGAAWQAGAEKAAGDYIHFGADDVEPHEGWWEPLVQAIDAYNVCTCSVVLNPDLTVQSAGMSGWQPHAYIPRDWQKVEHTLTPFVNRAQWDLVKPVPPIHYCSDIWFSAVLAAHGIPTVVRSESRIVHHNHPVGRGAGMEENARNVQDRVLYHRYLKERMCASSA